MKKLLLSLILLLPVAAYADTITSGSIGLIKISTGVSSGRSWGEKINSNMDVIAATMTGVLSKNSVISIYDEGIVQGNATTLNIVGAGITGAMSGSTATITVTATGGGSGTIAGSTQTSVLNIPFAYMSTISVCGIPGACFNTGVDTITIVGYWADAVYGSTVGFTGLIPAISTGGYFGLPLAPSRFNNTTVSVATASTIGTTQSPFISTSVLIRPGETFGVLVSTVANSGIVTREIKFHYDYWVPGRY